MEGSQKIAPQTPIEVYSGDEGAHPKIMIAWLAVSVQLTLRLGTGA